MNPLAFDHLVVAAATLGEGVRWCESTLGITPGAGGKHALMGTHNRLFSVASDRFPNAYFEIIAIDPDAPPPGRARWFGLDAIDLAAGPRLIHWVARTEAIEASLAALRERGIDAGRAVAAARGALQWRIAVRDDGALLARGAVPTLIEWGRQRHPAASMPASGVTLQSLHLRGLPAVVQAPCGAARADGAGPALSARLLTPLGPVTIASHD